MLMRGTGAALLAAAGLWFGCEMARCWTQHRRTLEQTAALLQYLLDAVQYQRLPAKEILAGLRRRDGLSHLVPARCICLQDLPPPSGLTGEQRSHFTACIRQFGHQGVQPQCQQLRREITYFAGAAQALKERERTAAAICPRVGICIGMMLALAFF